MDRYNTTDPAQRDRAPVTAAEWFGGGQRILYDPESARVLTEEEAVATPGTLRVFERVAAAEQEADTVWLTLLPGFPDGSYGWAQVDRMLGDDLGPRLYVRRTVVVTFDYTSLALLELLRRQLERHAPDRATTHGTAGPVITAAFMMNGGLFADAHTHPWRGTPLLRTPLGALGMRRAQGSPRVFATAMVQARMYSRGYRPAPEQLAELWSAVTRRDGAAFMHNAAGFVGEHRRHARRWDLAAIARDLDSTVDLYVGGSDARP